MNIKQIAIVLAISLMIILAIDSLSNYTNKPAYSENRKDDNKGGPGLEAILPTIAILIMACYVFGLREKKEKKAQKKEHDERGYE